MYRTLKPVKIKYSDLEMYSLSWFDYVSLVESTKKWHLTQHVIQIEFDLVYNRNYSVMRLSTNDLRKQKIKQEQQMQK
jgi:hypothetical protein